MNRRWCAWGVVLGLAGIACVKVGRGTAQTVQIIDVEAEPTWGADIRLVEELRIGSLSGGGPTAFGRIEAMAVDDAGNVVVYDAQATAVLRFDRSGNFLGQVGRAGEGPGEYRRIAGLGILSDGTVVTWDIGLQRVSLYDSSGTYVRSWRFCCGIADEEAFRTDSRDRVYVKTALIRSEGGRQRRQWPRAYVRLTSEGAVEDTLVLPPAEAPSRPLILPMPEGERLPFAREWHHGVSAEGNLIQAHSDRYELELLTASGKRIVRRAIARTPVRHAERNQWEAWTRFVDRQERARGFTHEFDAIPETKPYFRDLHVDADGRIWVDRYVQAEATSEDPLEFVPGAPPFRWREPPTFDVLGTDGRFFGTVRLPGDTRFMHSRGDEVWGIAAGEFEEQYIVRFRLLRGAGVDHSPATTQLVSRRRLGSGILYLPLSDSSTPDLRISASVRTTTSRTVPSSSASSACVRPNRNHSECASSLRARM